MTSEVSEITGKLELLPNPCTTKPCLPGLAFAVVADGVPYFLSSNGGFVMHNADLPPAGETVVAVGVVLEAMDVNGNPFKTIKLKSVVTTAL